MFSQSFIYFTMFKLPIVYSSLLSFHGLPCIVQWNIISTYFSRIVVLESSRYHIRGFWVWVACMGQDQDGLCWALKVSAKFRAKLYGSLGVLLPMAGTTVFKVRTVYYCVLSCLLERVTTILMFTTKKCVICFYARARLHPTFNTAPYTV